MTEILLGGVGAILIILAFVVGTVYGYKISAAAKVGGEISKLAASTTEEITKQRQQMKDENEAFQSLMGYDIQTAYGRDIGPQEFVSKESDA